MMRDYWIVEHNEEAYQEHLAKGGWHYFDMLGALNVIDAVIGEVQMLIDSRGKRHNRKRNGGRVRFILPRTAIYTDGLNGQAVKKLLGKYGIRPRRYMFDHKNTYFTVRASQATWAVTVLDRWKAGTLGASWAEKAQERRRAQRGPGLFDRLMGRK